MIGADSLAYLSLEGLQLAIERPAAGFCRACLTGDYPVAPESAARRQGALRGERRQVSELSAADLRRGGCLAGGGGCRRRPPARRSRVDEDAARARVARRLRGADLGREVLRPRARRGHRHGRLEGAPAAADRQAARAGHRSRRDERQRRHHLRRRAGAVPRLRLRRPSRSRSHRPARRGRRRRLPSGGCALLGGETAEMPDLYGAGRLRRGRLLGRRRRAPPARRRRPRRGRRCRDRPRLDGGARERLHARPPPPRARRRRSEGRAGRACSRRPRSTRAPCAG